MRNPCPGEETTIHPSEKIPLLPQPTSALCAEMQGLGARGWGGPGFSGTGGALSNSLCEAMFLSAFPPVSSNGSLSHEVDEEFWEKGEGVPSGAPHSKLASEVTPQIFESSSNVCTFEGPHMTSYTQILPFLFPYLKPILTYSNVNLYILCFRCELPH